MNVLHLALTNIRALRRRLYPLIALLAVTGAVGLGALGIAEHAQGTTDQRIEESTANRSITVDRPEPGTPTAKLTDSTAAGLARLPHVTSVQHRAQVSIALAPPGTTALLYATTHRPAVTPPITKSVRTALFPLRPGEIVAPATADGVDLTHLVGRTIDVETIRFVRPGEGAGVPDRARLAAVYDPTWQLDGPDAAYAADVTVIRWAARRAGVPEGTYPRTIGYDQLTVVTDTAAHTPDVMKSVQALGYPATTLGQQLAALPAVLELIRAAGHTLLAMLGIVAFAGAATVTGALSRQRATEVGILKAVGFRTRTVLTLLVTEMALTAALSALLAIALGAAASTAATVFLRGDRELAPYLDASTPLPAAPTLAALLALTVLVVTAGAFVPARRAANLRPAEAIRHW